MVIEIAQHDNLLSITLLQSIPLFDRDIEKSVKDLEMTSNEIRSDFVYSSKEIWCKDDYGERNHYSTMQPNSQFGKSGWLTEVTGT